MQAEPMSTPLAEEPEPKALLALPVPEGGLDPLDPEALTALTVRQARQALGALAVPPVPPVPQARMVRPVPPVLPVPPARTVRLVPPVLLAQLAPVAVAPWLLSPLS